MNLIAYVLQSKKIDLIERMIKEEIAIEIYSIEDIEDLINLIRRIHPDYSITNFSDRSISGISRTISYKYHVCITIHRREIFNGHYSINLFWGEKDIYEFDEYEIIKADEILWT